jgi:hypothetical protein
MGLKLSKTEPESKREADTQEPSQKESSPKKLILCLSTGLEAEKRSPNGKAKNVSIAKKKRRERRKKEGKKASVTSTNEHGKSERVIHRYNLRKRPTTNNTDHETGGMEDQ